MHSRAAEYVVTVPARGLRMRFRALEGWCQRLRGLLGSDRGAGPVVLVGCSRVHTFMMRYPIDLAFVDENGVVLRACTSVAPWRIVGSKGAFLTFESPESNDAWLVEGDVIEWARVPGRPGDCGKVPKADAKQRGEDDGEVGC